MTRPARNTRPANRRQLVIAAAAELFYGRGYSNVTMTDVADAVAVGSSALYRHFRNKNNLLEAVVSDVLTSVEEVLVRATEDPVMDVAGALAAMMLQRRAIGVLWRREARYLAKSARLTLRDQLRRIATNLGDLLLRNRPSLSAEQSDFLAWAMLGVVTSVSFHKLDVSLKLLTDLTRSVTDAEIPQLQGPATSQHAERRWAPSRKEAILNAAAGLFAAHGYAEVTLDDIGAAVGIAGASIYNHFTSKADVLTAALSRSNDILRVDMHRELSRATGPHDAVRRLLASYRDFAVEHADVIRLIACETDQLPEQDRHQARAVQHEYIAEWVQLLRQINPRADPIESRVRVQAALNMINDIATTSHLRLASVDIAIEVIAARLIPASYPPVSRQCSRTGHVKIRG